jgi:hypothetical protein
MKKVHNGLEHEIELCEARKYIGQWIVLHRIPLKYHKYEQVDTCGILLDVTEFFWEVKTREGIKKYATLLYAFLASIK